MFYIYEWFNIDTNEVFYVGKGIYNRYKVKKRNKKFNEYIKNNNCNVRIIEYYEDELMCFKREEELIKQYKEKGQCKCNYFFGGCGGVKTYWNIEMREKMSKENPMKSKSQRERMSKNNPMKKPEIAKVVGEKHTKPFYVGDIKFNNLNEASSYYKLSQTTISGWIKRGKNPKGEKCFHIKQKIKPIIPNKEKCYILFRNQKFNTIREISEKENIPYKTLENWLKKGFSSKGEYIRYSNDKKEYVYIKPNKTHNNIIIKINGKIYNSIKEATIKLNINHTTLTHILNGGKTIKYKHLICEYVNQHPSQEKTDKSILEGSTTNE